jgi:peptide/nickel transport system permease protein
VDDRGLAQEGVVEVIALFLRRIAQLPPTLLITSMLMFLILSMGPSPLAQLQEYANMNAADLAKFAAKYGLDEPLYRQYLTWLGHFITGDLGTSIRTFQPAGQMIAERLPLTLFIATSALLLSVGVGVPLGAYVAVRRYSRIDYVTTFLTLALMAMPAFFMALMLQLVAVKIRDTSGAIVFFTSGVPDDGASAIDWMQRLTLPILTLALTHVAMWVRYQRGELLQVLSQEYVRSARAKGIPERMVIMRHAMRNAILPIVTLIAVDMGKVIAGAAIVECVFGLPGMGQLLLDSATQHDTTVVLDILMIIATMMVLSNSLADVIYGVLDPRVRSNS